MDLYAEQIIDLSKNPLNRGALANASFTHSGVNTTCGDHVRLYVLVKGGKVKEAMWEGDGCAISIAAVSVLTEEMKGKNLKVLSKEWAAEKVVTKIAEAIRVFHNVDAAGCPFGVAKDGDVLIHGDASLPNFIFEGDNLSGYIDLGDMAIGNKETDFAAAIWSLQFNLGKGYGKMFLEKYGMRGVTEEGVERLRLKYEDMQDEWGLL